MAGGEFANVLEDCPADGFGAAERLGHSFEKSMIGLGIVELVLRAARVCHTVGVDDDNVTRVQLELCLFIMRIVHDAQWYPGDLLANLFHAPIGTANEQWHVTCRGEGQSA